jgi:hypothetical protein
MDQFSICIGDMEKCGPAACGHSYGLGDGNILQNGNDIAHYIISLDDNGHLYGLSLLIHIDELDAPCMINTNVVETPKGFLFSVKGGRKGFDLEDIKLLTSKMLKSISKAEQDFIWDLFDGVVDNDPRIKRQKLTAN